LNWP